VKLVYLNRDVNQNKHVFFGHVGMVIACKTHLLDLLSKKIMLGCGINH